LAGSLVLDAESVVERTLSDLHFVAMFPRLAAARLAARRGDWANAVRAAATAVELGRRGAGRVELAAALLTAAAASRTCPPPAPARDGLSATNGPGGDPRGFPAPCWRGPAAFGGRPPIRGGWWGAGGPTSNGPSRCRRDSPG